MNDPGDYARRVRARPYGPREVTAGGVTAWFHGPFAVVTFTAVEDAITVRADIGDASAGPSSGDDLAALFVAAGAGQSADLPRPDRLVGECPLPGEDTTTRRGEARLLGLTVRPAPEGMLITAALPRRSVEIMLREQDAHVIAAATRSWVAATEPSSRS